jgi:hypothetical protein
MLIRQMRLWQKNSPRMFLIMLKLPSRVAMLVVVGNKSSLKLGYRLALMKPPRNISRANKLELSEKVAQFPS